jgi:hypothetical protein
MDQEQNVDVSPVLTNLQAIHLHLAGGGDGFCGKITGRHIRRKRRARAERRRPFYISVTTGSSRSAARAATPAAAFRSASCRRVLYAVRRIRAGHIHSTPYIKVLPGRTAHQTVKLSDCPLSHC